MNSPAAALSRALAEDLSKKPRWRIRKTFRTGDDARFLVERRWWWFWVEVDYHLSYNAALKDLAARRCTAVKQSVVLYEES